MKKYLYGAAVQGIQDFIFKTNDLDQIMGASALVERICTSAFEEYAEGGSIVVQAAGNVKCIFDDKDACSKAVLEFPKKVMCMAPGITISQAVVEIEDGVFKTAVEGLEKKLKVQRNKPQKSLLAGLMGIKRANNTGFPVVEIRGKKFLDESTKAKFDCVNKEELCQKSFGNGFNMELPSETDDIKGKNDWIAVIHADGNGLGKVVQKIGGSADDYREFSQKLDIATTNAAQYAYDKICDKFEKETIVPIWPVVLSGDDMTVIIRGELAIDYVQAFIEAFERETGSLLTDQNGQNILEKENVFKDGKKYLTACAGVAFIKASYPFYYGYELAETLCTQAKKDTKAIAGTDNLPASCIMFHKVQDSFISDYDDIVKRELTACDKLSFKAGPYYVKEMTDRLTIDKLVAYASEMDKYDGLKSGVRQWLSLRLKDAKQALQRKTRLEMINEGNEKAVNLLKKVTEEKLREKEEVCIAYDVLAYHTIMNQETNNKEDGND